MSLFFGVEDDEVRRSGGSRSLEKYLVLSGCIAHISSLKTDTLLKFTCFFEMGSSIVSFGSFLQRPKNSIIIFGSSKCLTFLLDFFCIS